MDHLIGISDLRQNVARVLREVQANHEPYVVVSHSRPAAVILSPAAYQAMCARLRELEEAELLRVVEEGEQEFRQGKARRLRSLRHLR